MSFSVFTMLPSEEIREKINIVDLIGEYVPLKKAGANFRAVCPFHTEKTPSFMVSQPKQIWHCFGCGLGGDIFEFIKQIEGVEFPEALHMLAARAGVVLKKPTIEYQKETDQKKTLYAINELAAKYFAKVLAESHSAQAARDYLAKRRLRPETIEKWQLGYAPDDFHTFENFIVSKGFQKKEAAEAGLLVKKDETGEYFDRFRGRVMFPLFDLHSRVVGFTARILKDVEGQAKYMNSPETAIYSKSHLVYGLHLAKSEIRKTGEVIVVEGNMDVITCHEAAAPGGQAGFGNVIGSSGTALTESQLLILKRFTLNIVFAFDVDAAGLMATRRAVELALSLGFNVRILAIPKSLAKDPDELIRRDRGLWEQEVKSAKNFLDFYFDSVFANINLESAVEKKQVVADLLPLLSLLPDPIDRSHYTKQISSLLGFDEKILLELLNRKLRSSDISKQQPQPAPSAGNKKSKREVLERRVLGLLLKFGQNLAEDWKGLRVEDFSIPVLQEIYRLARERVEAQNFELKNFAADNPKLAPEVELLLFAVDNEFNAFPDWNLPDMKQQFLGNFKLEVLKEDMNRLATRIRQAEHVGRVQEAKVLSGEFNNLTRELSKYHIR